MDDIITPQSVLSEQNFTILMPFFSRKASLPMILTHYLRMAKVDKVILMWYKKQEDMPRPEDLLSNPDYNKRLLIKHMREDNLMLRFIMFPEIKTKAILSCDDDIIVRKDDLYRIFEKWKAHPHGIVGPFIRLTKQISPKIYRYVWNPIKHYNIVLTNVAFFHRDWVFVLENELPQQINDTVRKWTNCEDIAFNFLVSSYCHGQAVFWVKPTKQPIHFSKPNQSLSGRKSHARQRDLCVTKFVEYYNNSMPLKVFMGPV